MCFVAPEQKMFYGQFFLLPDSVERVLKPGAYTLAKFFTPWSCLQCVLWLQSRSCFTANFFCYLTLSSVYWNQGLHYFVKFFHALILFTKSRSCFTANLLLPDSVERVLKPGA